MFDVVRSKGESVQHIQNPFTGEGTFSEFIDRREKKREDAGGVGRKRAKYSKVVKPLQKGNYR